MVSRKYARRIHQTLQLPIKIVMKLTNEKIFFESTREVDRQKRNIQIFNSMKLYVFRSMIECSILSKERPTVLQNLPLPLIMQYHINTVDVSRFLKTISHMLQDQSKRDHTP